MSANKKIKIIECKQENKKSKKCRDNFYTANTEYK